MQSCVYFYVYCVEGFLTPNRCHYFPLASSHLSVSAEAFFIILSVLFCARTHTLMGVWRGEGKRASLCVCAHVWESASWIFVSGKVKLSCAFRLGKEVRKIPCNKGGTVHQVSRCQRSWFQVSGTNTIFHLVQREVFELTPWHDCLSGCQAQGSCVGEREGIRPGEEGDDTINYISIELTEGVKLWIPYMDEGNQTYSCCYQHHGQRCMSSSPSATSNLITVAWFYFSTFNIWLIFELLV